MEDLASEFNLSFTAFGKGIRPQDGPTYGSLILSEAFNSSLEPAPITPTGPDAAPYRLLSATIRATYESGRHNDNEGQLTIAPFMGGGNTGMESSFRSLLRTNVERSADTQFYWNLTQHIFRYNHATGDASEFGDVHTVNEGKCIVA